MADVFSLFAPETAAWFAEKIGQPTAVQQEAWPAIAAGGPVLVSAPTGTGKTLTAFLGCIDRLKTQARRGELRDELQVVYISPLKALGNDIRENLRRPLDGIPGEVTAAIRTGDTTAAERRAMIKRPPHILITTPESLYLLLSSQSGRGLLHTARTVIVDELHAVISGKRGAHLMFSLARLDRLCGRPLQRIGLSATIEPLPLAAEYLAYPQSVRIIAPAMRKEVDIEVNAPLPDMRVLPEGTIWPELARAVYAHCQQARTVIAFVEGRAQAERLAYAVNQLGGADFARTHHGSVSKEQRHEAEQSLRSGQLRLLCATSSMELGIDVGEVDLVLQIGFPRTISSTMQRLGRAGHNPGRTSVMHMFPRTAAECVACGLTAQVAMTGGIEHAHPPRLCLDVLAQHLVAMAAVESYTVADALALAQHAYPFREVTEADLRGLLGMLAGDYEHAQDVPARPRLVYDRIHGTVSGDNYSRMLALSSGGTIPDRGLFTVRTAEGTRLGELDEEYVFEARVGDKFLLGAFAWRIAAIQRDTVVVQPTTPEGAQSPFWKGDGNGRDYRTGLAFGRLLRGLQDSQAGHQLYAALKALRLDDAAARNGGDFLARQLAVTGCLPSDKTVLVEHFTGPAGEHQVMIHAIFGRPVNAGLALLLEELTRRTTGMDIRCFDDDDGLLLHPYGGDADLPDGLLQRLRPGTAQTLLTALLPATPLFNMAFRYNAGRALMMGLRSGKRQPLWVQRLRGAQALDHAVGHAEHPLMRETRRECLEDYFDIDAIEAVLRGLASGAITVHEVHLSEASPMSLPLRRAAEAEFMYDYFPRTSAVHRAVNQALDAAQELTSAHMIAPGREQLARAGERRRQPQDAEQLHALLMTEGDLIAGEVAVPLAWLEELARTGRAAYIEPGLWIAAEQLPQYQAALELADEGERRQVARRCLRYRGGHDALLLAERYAWPVPVAEALLAALVAAGAAAVDAADGLHYHADVYERAQRETVAARRQQAVTQPPERYAALLAQRLRTPGATPEQLQRALGPLLGRPFPPSLWEEVLLPARWGQTRAAALDELFQQGGLCWQMTPGERPLLAFYRQADIDFDQPPYAAEAPLDEDERYIVEALQKRGASFAQNLSGLTSGRSAVEVLLGLAERGLARADSFWPVRQWLEKERLGKKPPRQRAMARARTAMNGRWELTRPLRNMTSEQRLEQAFDRAALLCRETWDEPEIAWAEALEALRVWEYTGRARRGYFVRGLSGAQFIRESDAVTVLAALEQPSADIVWLNAADPAQAWGHFLSHDEAAAFTCVPGTAVALRAGVPVALLERQGGTLRSLVPEALPEALAAFVRDYRAGRILAGRQRVTVKQYPPEAAAALAAAGFIRAMHDYELWQRVL